MDTRVRIKVSVLEKRVDELEKQYSSLKSDYDILYNKYTKIKNAVVGQETESRDGLWGGPSGW